MQASREKAKEEEAVMKQANAPRVILVVEDQGIEWKALSCILRTEGYFVLTVADEMIALNVAHNNPLSLIILNSERLSAGGLDLCCQLRSSPTTRLVPLLMIVRDENELPSLRRSGVAIDDYLVTPFLWEEIDACVRTLLRVGKRKKHLGPAKAVLRLRGESIDEGEHVGVLTVDDLSIDVARRRVTRRGQPIEIGSALLFDLLVYFVRHRGMVLTLDQLWEHVWNYTDASVNGYNPRTIYVHIHWLRDLLDDHHDHPDLIQTVRGVGYRFKDAEIHA